VSLNVNTPRPSLPKRYAPSDTTAQNGKYGMMSFWILAGSIDGMGEFSVNSGRARRR
jgi:hypothetical protein